MTKQRRRPNGQGKVYNVQTPFWRLVGRAVAFSTHIFRFGMRIMAISTLLLLAEGQFMPLFYLKSEAEPA
jgi:hypothetical protein